MTERSPLARFVGAPDGPSFELALQRGQRVVQSFESDARLEIETQLTQMATLLGDAGAVPSPEVRMCLSACVNTVMTLAGLTNRPALAMAAQSCFELMDDLGLLGAWDQSAVNVHYSALRMLNGPDEKPRDEVRRVLAGLKKVVVHTLAQGAANGKTA